MTEENNYYEDTLHLNNTSKTTVNSQMDTLTQRFNYPHEMVASGNDPVGVYSAMLDSNIVNTTIETSFLKNDD